MEKKIFMYSIKYLGRRTNCTGVTIGVLHADSADDATAIITDRMGANAYGFQLIEVTDQNAEAYIGIPSGELLSFGSS